MSGAFAENSLLEENGPKAGIKSADTLLRSDLAESTDETAREGGL